MEVERDLQQRIEERNAAIERVNQFVKANLDELMDRKIVKVSIDYRRLERRTR